MALCELHWQSQILGKQVATYAILPDHGEPPFPTFYLLHGLSDDHTIWQRRTRIEHYVRDLPLIVVLPDGFRGFYTDNTRGRAHAKYIAEELVAQIERLFPADPSRNRRCIGGLSMGGYGALRLALGYPGRFASATSHSGALLLGSQRGTRHSSAISPEEFRQVFGAQPKGSNHDLLELARRCKQSGKLPELRIDCGTEDFLLADNRSFHRSLTQMRINHEYEEFPGSHDWDYWDLHVQEAIAFHARALGLEEKAG